MELVQLWVLVAVACLVAGTDEHCSTETVSGHILNLKQSKVEGANVEVLQVFHADSEVSCVSDCCSGRFGSCTIAGFNGQTKSESVNCYHFRCTPLSSCTFLASKETTSFKVHLKVKTTSPAVGGSSTSPQPSIQDAANVTSTKTTATSEGHNERTRTTARKGVNFTEDGDSVGHMGRGDGTNSKPRKGVHFEETKEETAPLKNDNTRVKDGEGVDLVPQESANNASSKAAVEQKSATAPSVQSTSSSSSPVPTSNSSPSPSGSTRSPGSSPTPVQVQPNSIKPHQQEEAFSESSAPLVSPTLRPSSYSPVQEDILPVATASSWPQETTVTTVLDTDSGTTSPRPSEKPSNATSQLSQTSPNEEDLKFSMSSMHIVIALVMGLLLLFVVLGIVGKQVYDIWLRRHYHRMDFLIDGMYDSYA